MFSFVLFDPRDPDDAERRRPPGSPTSVATSRPVLPPRVRRG